MIRRLRAAGKIGSDVLTSDESREKKTFRIAPRPYMGPALNVNREKIAATVHDGVLEVTLPKMSVESEEKNNRQIEIV